VRTTTVAPAQGSAEPLTAKRKKAASPGDTRRPSDSTFYYSLLGHETKKLRIAGSSHAERKCSRGRALALGCESLRAGLAQVSQGVRHVGLVTRRPCVGVAGGPPRWRRTPWPRPRSSACRRRRIPNLGGGRPGQRRVQRQGSEEARE
jgi:hypothetical protein